MSKESKVSRKDILPQIEQIKVKTEELAVIVESIPQCFVKTSYATSVKNLRTKNENFLTIKGPKKGLSDEEKAIIAAMRAGKKVEISEVPSMDGDSTTPNESVSSKKKRK